MYSPAILMSDESKQPWVNNRFKEWIVKSIVTTDDSDFYITSRTFLDTIENGHQFQPELGIWPFICELRHQRVDNLKI